MQKIFEITKTPKGLEGGSGFSALAHTNRNDRYCNLETESAQLADSVKIRYKWIQYNIVFF